MFIDSNAEAVAAHADPYESKDALSHAPSYRPADRIAYLEVRLEQSSDENLALRRTIEEAADERASLLDRIESATESEKRLLSEVHELKAALYRSQNDLNNLKIQSRIQQSRAILNKFREDKPTNDAGSAINAGTNDNTHDTEYWSLTTQLLQQELKQGPNFTHSHRMDCCSSSTCLFN